MTHAAIGFGIVLECCSTSGGTYVPVAEVLDIKLPKSSIAKVPVDTYDSATVFGLQITGWGTVSDSEIKLVYYKTQKATLYGLLGTPYYFKVVRPDGTSIDSWYGFISEFGDETPLKTAMTNDFKITVSGPVAFTVGA